jgi:hypothetical protein
MNREDTIELLEENEQLKAKLDEARADADILRAERNAEAAEVRRLQMEADASCNAEELRQARAEAENSEREFVEFRDEMDRRLGLEVRKFEDAQARYEQAEEQLARLRKTLRKIASAESPSLPDLYSQDTCDAAWEKVAATAREALAAVRGEKEESK